MFLGTATGSIKSSLKDRYAYRWPSTEDAAFDLFNPARIYQWCLAIHRVRVAYAKLMGADLDCCDHNGTQRKFSGANCSTSIQSMQP